MILTDEQFKAAYVKLPLTLREFLASDDLTKITLEMGSRYGLHVDSIGALERETSNMLLGLINPEQFVGELKSVGIPPNVIGTIVEELNAKIFIPLREKMQHPDEDEDEDDDDSIPEHQAMPTQIPAPQPAPPQFPLPPTPSLTYTQPAPIPTVVTPVMPVAPAYIPPTPPPPAPSISQYAEPFGRVPVPAAVNPFMPPASVAIPVQPITGPVARPLMYTPPADTQIPSVIKAPAPLPPAITPNTKTGPLAEAHTMKQDMQLAQEMYKKEQVLKAQSKPVTNPYTYVPPKVERPPVATKIVLPDDGVLSGQKNPSGPQTTPSSAQIKNPQASSATRTENQESLYSALKQYGIDPYREPAE